MFLVVVLTALAVTACSSLGDTNADPKPTGSIKPTGKTNLAFSGAVTATATTAATVWPVYTASAFDSNSGAPDWSTECVFAGGDSAAWSATVTVQTPGNLWTVTVANGESFGNPTPGPHTGVRETLVRDYPGSLSLTVESQQPIASYLQSAGATSYDYYIPTDRNNGTGSVSVDPSLTSGTVDVWVTPVTPSPLEVHITGVWSCD